jgi:VHL beta domain
MHTNHLELASFAALSCQSLQSIKSTDTGQPTQIQFRNSTVQIVQLFWVDYEGKEKFYFQLPPNQFETFDTYVGHPWIVRDLTGTCLDVFVPEKTSPILAEIAARVQ